MPRVRPAGTLRPENLKPDVRARIEQAAMAVFAEQEFHRVSLVDIARQANASLQTIYRYYGSKEALLNACLHNGLGQLAERMIDHLQGIETYKDRLRKVFWVVLHFFENEPLIGRMMINSVYPGNWRSDVTASQKQLSEAFMTVLREGRQQGVLTDAVSERVLLDYFYGVLLRLCQMHIVRGETESLAAQTPVLFDMLWRAIARETPDA